MSAPEQEVKPKKAKKAKPATDAVPRDRSSKNFDKTAAITMLATANPKRVGSKAHATFEKYAGANTVGDFITAGGSYEALAWDSARGFISIVGYTPKMVEKKAKAAKKAKAPQPEAPATA